MDGNINQYDLEQDNSEQNSHEQEGLEENLEQGIEEETDEQMEHLINIFFGKEDKRTVFTVQQGEYNSRKVVAKLWENNRDGNTLLNLKGRIVKVVYKYGAITTPEYSTTQVNDNEVSFILPKRVLAALGTVHMQLGIYKGKGLLKSAVVPFKVLGSIIPSMLPESDEDVQSDLLYILGNITPEKIEAWDALEENTKKYTDNKFKEFKEQYAEKLEEFEEKLSYEVFGKLVSYTEQTPDEEQQIQARKNIGVDYATDEEVLEAMVDEGVVIPIATEDGSFLACADGTVLIV